MQCNDVLPKLNALADGELGAGESRDLRQHLGHCAGCAQELIQIQEISAQAREWRAVSAPATLPSRIAEALAKSPAVAIDASCVMTESPTAVPSSPVGTPFQRNPAGPSATASNAVLPRRAGRSWRAGAAMLGVGIAAGILALLTAPARKAVAFAAVLQAMQHVKTIHWVISEQGVTAPKFGLGDAGVTVHLETWARLDTPAYALLLTPDGFSRTLITTKRMTTILDGRRTQDVPIGAMRGVDREQALRTFILAQVISPGKDASANTPGALDAGRLPDKNGYGFSSEQTELDGRSVVRFFQNRRSRTGSVALSLWVDPDTQLVLRSEAIAKDAAGKHPDVHVVCDHFRYNETPPPGIFEGSKR